MRSARRFCQTEWKFLMTFANEIRPLRYCLFHLVPRYFHEDNATLLPACPHSAVISQTDDRDIAAASRLICILVWITICSLQQQRAGNMRIIWLDSPGFCRDAVFEDHLDHIDMWDKWKVWFFIDFWLLYISAAFRVLLSLNFNYVSWMSYWKSIQITEFSVLQY